MANTRRSGAFRADGAVTAESGVRVPLPGRFD
jgi:hypothetical protein